ncbi:hexose transporter hxt1 [Maudiozyma exigua]|uniref:Hexose transporter hxt1 n=1 Tax=Maudiozyma exigua TaxID=34358 RepID=A0A9P7B9G6_MAUEX|nr:hexose transporter hxt1 [Kazachstania exigua]
MSSSQSSFHSNIDMSDTSDIDVYVSPHVEKEYSDRVYDNETINRNSIEPPKRGYLGYLTIYLLCIPISFGGFLPGWDSGITAGFINMDNFKMNFGSYKHSTGEYYLSNVRMGLLVAMFSVGCAIGGLLFARFADTLGRRLAIVIVVLVYMIGAIIQISSNHKWYQYFIGKIIYGLGAGGCSVLCPMLLSEIAPKDMRGGLVSLYQLNMTFGIFLGYCSVYGTRKYNNTAQWRIPVGLCFLWALIIIIGMLLVPESPRYLIEQERHDEARASIAKINKVSPEDAWVHEEAEEIIVGVLAQREQGEASWKELFSPESNMLQRLITGILVQTFLQLTGENYFFFYGTTIFKSVGLTDGFETSIILGTVNFFSTIIAVIVVDKIGRRKCLLFGAAGMMACMVIFASVGVKCLYPHGDDGPSSKGAGNVMIVFTCFYLFCFATSWAPVAYIVVAESFPSRFKSRAMSISTACNWLWQFLIGFFTPFITGSIHFYYGYVFVGCLVAMFLYVFFFLPETIGLSLEEIQLLYEEGVKPWKSASWVPPSRRGKPVEESESEKKNWKEYLKFSKSSN